jgi:hypothetical protein
MNSAQEKEMRRLVGVMLSIQKQRQIHPLDFQVFIGALLANVVGAIPDDYWERMMVTKPCEIPRCDCHVVAAHVMFALDILRNDHRKTLTERSSHN